MFLSKYGVARHIYIPMVKRAVVDHAVGADWTPAAGDVKISKDGGAAANVTNLPTAIAMGNSAIWDFSFTATEMQAAQIVVTIADTATKAVEDSGFIIETYGDANGQHAFDLDTASSAQTGDSFARLGAPAGASISADIATIDNFVDTEVAAILTAVDTEVATIITTLGTPAGISVSADVAAVKAETASIQSDTNDIQTRLPAALVGGRIDASVGAVANDAITGAALDATAGAEIADAVWDEATSGHVTAGTFGQAGQTLRTGTAQAGAAGTITLDAGASAVTDFYKNAIILVTGGTGVGQSRTISAYNGTTKVASVTPNWGTNPANDSIFVILPGGAIAGASAPTAAEVADAVWDEAIADHSGVVGSTAEQLAAAGAAGDPWATAVPGAYGAGTAGAILGGLDDSVAAVQASVDLVPTTAENAAAVWDEVLTGATHNIVNSAGRRLRQIASLAMVDSSVNDAGPTTTSFVTALTSAVDNFYNDQLLIFTSGNLSGQARPVLDYNGTTKAITVSEAFTSAPANGDTFTLQATHIHPITQVAGAVWDEAVAGHLTAGTAGAFIDAIKSKTDNLPTDPADQSLIIAATDAITTLVNDLPTNAELATALGTADDAMLTQIALVKAKTDLIPGTIDGYTFSEIVTLAAAVLLGKASGLATTTAIYRAINDSKTRVTATVDVDGNRSAVTLDAT